jgi:branched-chain amino acid transport system permease protein
MADATIAVPRRFAASWMPSLPGLLVVLVFAALPPVFIAVGDPFLTRLFMRAIVFAIAAVALNFVLGFGGLASMLHAGFIGLGGYVVGILAHHDFNAEPLLTWPIEIAGTSNLLISVPLAVLVCAAFALATGVICSRTQGIYFIMITLAFNQMLFYLFVALDQYGGEDGLQLLSDLHAGGAEVPGLVPYYYVCLGVLLAVLILVQRLVGSRFGTALRALSQNERRLVALGIPAVPVKIVAFVISGAIAGLAGALFAIGQKFVSPADLSWLRSGELVMMVMLGGMNSVWGPAVGAAVFVVLELVLSSWTMHWQLPFGIFIVASTMLLRGGLADLGSIGLRFVRRRSTP